MERSRRQKDRTGPGRNSLSAMASVLQDPCLEGSWAARGEPTLRRTWAVSERGAIKSPVTLKRKESSMGEVCPQYLALGLRVQAFIQRTP